MLALDKQLLRVDQGGVVALGRREGTANPVYARRTRCFRVVTARPAVDRTQATVGGSPIGPIVLVARDHSCE